ncbi:MAG: helix-turn-helix transcriptional regulator [Clostridiales bacterium]|nr:helix-turn-helix transcriptional regulator [Clostridiales bacterium]
MNLNKAIVYRLLKLLSEKVMTIYRYEKESGISHSASNYIFNETNKDVKFSTIVKVCYILRISLEEFFSDSIFDINKLDFELVKL